MSVELSMGEMWTQPGYRVSSVEENVSFANGLLIYTGLLWSDTAGQRPQAGHETWFGQP